MIVLNKNLEIIYLFNFDKLIEIITMRLITKKAYKGYVYYATLDDKNAEYFNYKDFCNLEIWRVKFSFQIYIERVLKVKQLGFNPTNKEVLKCYFKNCLLKVQTRKQKIINTNIKPTN